MLALEVLQRGVGRIQLLLVILQLLIDEFLRARHILAGAAQASLDKDGEQRLHHLLGEFGIGILVADGVEVFAPAVGNGDAIRQRVEHAVGLLRRRGLEIHVGHARDFFQGRARHQHARHELDLLLHVGLHREARKQRLQQALRVHIDARAGCIAVGQEHHPGPAGDRQQPGDDQNVPAAVPDRLDLGKKLLK